MEENIVIDTTDRISELPEFIVHHILSFLDSPAKLVRMSVLSKKWFALTASFPIFDFNIYDIGTALGIPCHTFEECEYVKDRFFKYVTYTMSRFCEENVRAHRFKLTSMLMDSSDVYNINKWIGLAVKKDLQVLIIDIHLWPSVPKRHSAEPMPMYRLPNILLCASSLTSLTIHNCELPSSLMVDDLKFKSLKLLELFIVTVSEEVIKCLTTSCPLLEEFYVRHCYGFSRFCVFGHQHLQKVDIYCTRNSRVERIEIEAPNLCVLLLMDWTGIGAPSMNFASCKKLTTLSYIGYPSLTSKGFADFSSNFPFVENLFLRLPDQCSKLKLSSHSLRTFVLHSQCDLEAVDINTPNLLLFECSSRSHVNFPPVRTSAPLKARMEFYPENDVNTLWFLKLRVFLDKKNGFKILKLRISTDLIYADKLKVIQLPPYELEHVELELDMIDELSVYVAVVDAVFWCCHPQSLTLKSKFPFIDFEERSHVVKFAYRKLLQQEDQDLTNIQIVLSSSSKAKKQFSNLNSLLTALPRDRTEKIITFIKEEVVQKAG